MVTARGVPCYTEVLITVPSAYSISPEGFLSAGADSAIWGGFCNLRGGFCNLLGQNMQSENCPLKKGRIMQSAGRGGICNLRGGLCNLLGQNVQSEIVLLKKGGLWDGRNLQS